MENSKSQDPYNKSETAVKANFQQLEGKSPFDVIALAASAGGLNALSQVLSGLPPDFPAVIVVQHLAPHHHSLMAEILGRRIHY